MSEYSERHSKEIREEAQERCFEARQDADRWASEFESAQPEIDIIEEANKRYNSFFERDAFIREAEEVFMLIERRKRKVTYGKRIHTETTEISQ